MAKKRVSRSRKRQLEEPDEFISISSRLLDIAMDHKEKISIVLGVILALIIGFVGKQYYSTKAESKVFALLGKGMAKYEMINKAQGPYKAYLGVEKDFKPILEKYSRRDGGKLAGVVYANICYNGGDYDKAIGLYNKSLEDFNEIPLVKNLILSSLGHAHEKKKDYMTAAKYFEMIISAPDAIMKDEALFNLGKLYYDMGLSDKSKDAFKKIISDFADSIYIEIVKERVAG